MSPCLNSAVLDFIGWAGLKYVYKDRERTVVPPGGAGLRPPFSILLLFFGSIIYYGMSEIFLRAAVVSIAFLVFLILLVPVALL